MFHDFRYALRTLRKNAGFALVAIISLALGIGANSAIFSLADVLVLRPMPVPHPSQVILVQSQLRGESLGGGALQNSPLSYPDFLDLRNRSKSYTGLTASKYSPFGFAVDKSAVPQMKFGVLASGNFFRVLQVQPVLGRGFRPDEDQVQGRDAVVVLGYDLWKTEFASQPDVVGRTLFLNGIAFTVIGVAPESFTGPDTVIRGALYVPMAMEPRLAGNPQKDMLEDRGNRQMMVHGRLKPGVSAEQAAAEALVISRQLAQAYPETNRTCSLLAETEMQSRLRGSGPDFMLIGVLLAMSTVVLLIACANVMNLMLSRGRARMREIAVRLAIGASRSRLIRQLLTESVIIAVLGGALGLFVAQAGVELFSQIRIPGDIPVALDFKLDPQLLWFTVFVSVASALLFGLVPALQSTRPELTLALKSGRAAGGKRKRFLGRNALVVAQVAGSLVLLVFATQAYRGASVLLSSPVGFRMDHILTASFDPSLTRYTPAQTEQFYKRLLERARTLSGVKAAALTEAVPMLPGGTQSRIVPEGVQLPPGAEAVSVISNTVSDDYFDVFDIPIVSGRFRLNGVNGTPIQIVGVARQSKYLFPFEPPFDYIYQPLAQNPQTGLRLALHTVGPPGEMATPLRELVRSLDSAQPVIGLRTMDEIFDQRARKTLNVLIESIAGLGLLGLVLAMVGLYGLMTYSVGLRQREIGIRMAIGADRTGVQTMILKQGMSLAGAGVAIGVLLWLPASKAVAAVVATLSFSWGLLALVAAGLLGAAALGAYLPARRASLVDPNSVLRQE
jgi:macrolide transport system ATP-binding/permease protein